MSDRDTQFGAYLAGFVLGGLIGAVAALLLAPQTGEETRTQIRDKSIELKDKAAETAEDYRVRAQEYVQSAQHLLDDQLKRVQTSMSSTEEALAEAEATEEAIEEAAEQLDEEAG